MPRGPADRGLFPPQDALTVTALACDRPTDDRKYPLSRFSVRDVTARARDLGLTWSYSTVWRHLDRDALRPWRYQQWLFPRDPLLYEKATPILELYHGRWAGVPLRATDLVLCADEMTGLQALSRCHRSLAPAPRTADPLPGRPGRDEDRRARVECEYTRQGTVCYQAFLNVPTGQVYGETVLTNGMETFEQSLGHCLAQPQFQATERVFLVVDNGSAHHPATSPARIQQAHPQVNVIHLPVHSSWLNQMELYFSIVQRKALTPRDFPSKDALRERLAQFEAYYNERAQPFRWGYTREHLEAYLRRLALKESRYAEAVARLEGERAAGLVADLGAPLAAQTTLQCLTN